MNRDEIGAKRGPTHMIINCWNCPHEVKLPIRKAPKGLDEHQMTKRMKCTACGAGWPQISYWPKPNSQWQ